MPSQGKALDRHSVRLLAVAWTLIIVGAVTVFACYRIIPPEVVLYRPPWADAAITGAKSFLTVGRVVFMGIGQLGAATAMTFASCGSVAWGRFWRWLGVVAGLKTLFQCVAFLFPPGTTGDMALTMATVTSVGLFALCAAWWWRRGVLRAHPPVVGAPRIWVFASLALWALFAIASRWNVHS